MNRTRELHEQRCLNAALKLHQYMVRAHWGPQGLMGPDPGIRINYRIGRFVKSYLRAVPWRDALYYLQAQGYWVLANWDLQQETGDATYRDLAVLASDHILHRQREDGAWDYPNPEWKGRVATVEGVWGSLGLLESYRRTHAEKYLLGALRWYEFLEGTVGYQQVGDQLAVNYFAHAAGARVPNNATDALRFLGELAEVTGQRTYLERCPGMVTFLNHVQLPSGEIPYTVDGAEHGVGRTHFQCFQYNAFQCLGLMEYCGLTGDERALPVIRKLLDFLTHGVDADGHAWYACGQGRRRVTYHAAALGAAFQRAGQMGIGGYGEIAERAFGYVLAQQRPDGSVPYSAHDYGVFRDNRSYPRYLAMIMKHLLSAALPGQDRRVLEPETVDRVS